MKNAFNLTVKLGTLMMVTVFSSAATAVMITPMQGQAPEQIQMDQADCTAYAQQSAASSAPSAQPSAGGRMKGAAMGAMAGISPKSSQIGGCSRCNRWCGKTKTKSS